MDVDKHRTVHPLLKRAKLSGGGLHLQISVFSSLLRIKSILSKLSSRVNSLITESKLEKAGFHLLVALSSSRVNPISFSDQFSSLQRLASFKPLS